MKPAIVIVTERQLWPVNAGNRARIVTLIRSLRRLGFRVVLVTPGNNGRRVSLWTWWQVDAMFQVDAPCFTPGSPSAYDFSAFEPGIAAAVKRYSPVAVIAEYIWMAPSLRAVDNGAVRLVDTHDVMHMRREFSGRVSDVWVSCTRDEERALFEECDVIMAIQPREVERFRELRPDKQVICVPHPMSVRPRPQRGNRPVVAVVGSANPCNTEGITSFLDKAWPVVLRAVPDAELRIYGELATSAPVRDRVIPVGHMSSLTRAYRDAAVFINPVNVGTGLKIKTVEALAHGKALVTTSCGSEGLEAGVPPAFVVADDMDQFGVYVANLLADAGARSALELAATRFAATEFSLEHVYEEFLGVLRARAGETMRRVAALPSGVTVAERPRAS